MPTLQQIREALANTVSAHLNSDGQQDVYCYPYVVSDAELPCVIVMPGGGGRDNKAGDFTSTMARGTEIWHFQLICLTPRSDDEVAQKVLDEMIGKEGARSVRQAIWNTPTLGIADCDAMVTGVAEYHGQYDLARKPHIGAALLVKVHAF